MSDTEKTQIKNNVVVIDYNGLHVSFTTDAWFNATEVAKRFGKRPVDWLRLPDTQEYIDVLSEQMGISEKISLIQSKRNSGTWLHPKLAVPFARWLDKRFGVWCDLQIEKIIKASYSPPNMMQLLLTTTATKWELRFSPEFYSALARVTKTKYNGHRQGTPCVFGQITLKWVYQEIMPEDVLIEVKARKGDSEKIHQWLSNGGQKLLDQQIAKIQAIALSSVDYKDFDSRCFQACKSNGQFRLIWAGETA